MKLLKNLLHTLYKWWMAFARALGAVNAAILLTIVYFVIIGPMSLIIRLLRKDLLSHRMNGFTSFWKKKEPVSNTIDQARHQF